MEPQSPAAPATPAPAAAPNAAPQPPAAPPPAGQDPQLTGRAALALFQDLPAPKDGGAPAASATGTPASPAAAAPTAKDAPAAEPPKDPQDPKLRQAWTKFAEDQAAFRRQQQEFQATLTEAQKIVQWHKDTTADPTKLFESHGADLAEKLVLAKRGNQPKTAEEQLAELQEWRRQQEQGQQQAQTQQQQAQQQAVVAAEVELVATWLKEAGGERFDTVLNMPAGADGLTGPQKVHRAFVQYYMPANKYDPKQHPESTTKEILLRLGDEIEKQETEGIATAFGRLKKVASRFAPAPAASGQQQQAPSSAQTPPAPAAPAPPTLNGKHSGDAAPPPLRRPRDLKQLDEEIAARFWPS